MAKSIRSERAGHKVDDEVDEAAQRRRDRITLVVFLIGAVLAIAGMFLLASFLSGS